MKHSQAFSRPVHKFWRSFVCMWMWIILLGAVVVPHSLYAQCAPPSAGMVAWWPLDESGGSTAHDIAGFPNDGTHMNGPTPVPGKVAGALSFNGSNSVEVTDHLELNFDTGDFSIDLWIQTTDDVGTRTILDKRVAVGLDTIGYSLYLWNGKPGLHLADGNFNNWTSSAFVADGNWHHVAATVDRDNPSGLLFYVDGGLVSTFDPRVRPGNLTNTAPFVMVIINITPCQFFGVTLEVLVFFKGVLGDQKIDSIYDAGTEGKCKCDPDHKLWTNLSGLADNYSTTPPPDPPPTPSVGLTTRIGSPNRGYDNPVVDRHFFHTFTVPPSGINAAWLVVGMQPVDQQSEDDRIALCFTRSDGTPGSLEWSAQIGASGGILPLEWNPTNYPDRVIITLDLKSLPGTPWTILGPLNHNGFLDLWVHHDTDIDFAQLWVCYRCVRPPADIVGWWPGDNNTNDIINHNNGKLMGGARYGSGKVGDAFYLALKEDYVEVPDDPTLDFGTGDLTIDVWIKTWSGQNFVNIVDKRDIVFPYRRGYRMYIYEGRLCFSFGDGSSDMLNHNKGNFDHLNDDYWHHVAVAVERNSTTGGKMYVDGVLDYTFDATNPPNQLGDISNSSDLRIGQRHGS